MAEILTATLLSSRALEGIYMYTLIQIKLKFVTGVQLTVIQYDIMPNRRQIITLTNDGIIYWHIYASLDHRE